jgi:signal transduction histidine kinase/HPt (histidine-containing phosphotransfer) domain-containing protein/ActR/RegA family two-component response regulator
VIREDSSIPLIGLFAFSASISFAIAIDFSKTKRQVENHNIILEETVRERTRDLEIQTEKLEEQTARAVAANQAKSQFLAAMSHEIRTPMNAILGLSEMTMRTGGIPETVYANIEKIRASGSSLLSIINDILDLSKIESGKLSIAPHDYELPGMISSVIQMNIVRIESKDIRFTLDAGPELPLRVRGDELRVKQILNNILSNAFKYTEKGFVSMSVFHRPAENPEENTVILVFKIADSGQGMKEEDVEKLFDEYSRFNTEANRTTEGTGLGMSITGKLAAMMGGNIQVESAYGKGSVFTVSIPQGKIDSGVIGEECAGNLRNFRLSPGRDGRTDIEREYMPYGTVLVVDDLETNLYVASGLMSPYGLTVETAGSGEEALEKIRAGKTYDVIFMDHMMPGMDGVETAGKIRGLGYRGTIAALTANAIAGQAEQFLQKGFDGFISKPIDTRQLDAALHKWVKDKHPGEAVNPAQAGAPASPVSGLHTGGLSGAFPAIPGVNTIEGIALTGGTVAGYRQVLAMLRRDAEERLPLLGAPPGTETLPLFTTQVHALKGALASIGAAGLSGEAAGLETAGRAGDAALIAEGLPGFRERLEELIAGIRAALDKDGSGAVPADARVSDLADSGCYALLVQLAGALKEQDAAAIDRILEGLERSGPGTQVREALESISDQVLMAEYAAASAAAERLLEELANKNRGGQVERDKSGSGRGSGGQTE